MADFPFTIEMKGFDKPFQTISDWLTTSYGPHGGEWKASVNHSTRVTVYYFKKQTDQEKFTVWGNLMGLFD